MEQNMKIIDSDNILFTAILELVFGRVCYEIPLECVLNVCSLLIWELRNLLGFQVAECVERA